MAIFSDISVFFRHLPDHDKRDDKQDHDEADENPGSAGGIDRSDVVICAVDQSREDDCEDAEEFRGARLTFVLASACKGVKNAHDHTEAGMTGDCGDGTDQCNAESIGKNVADVFPDGKAEGDENRVDHTVKKTVELRRFPGTKPEHEEFCTLFRKGDDDKIQNDTMEFFVYIYTYIIHTRRLYYNK